MRDIVKACISRAGLHTIGNYHEYRWGNRRMISKLRSEFQDLNIGARNGSVIWKITIGAVLSGRCPVLL